MMILLSIFFMSTLIVHGKNELKYFVSNLAYLIVLFALFISILGLLDFFNIYSYTDSKEIISSVRISDDRGSVDYNFALLPVFFGIISIFYFLLKDNSKFKRIYFNILLLIFSLDIILSGSRRGLITLIIILLFLAIAQIYAFYKENSLIGKLGYNSKYFLLSISILTILSTYITFKSDSSFKIKLLNSIGSKDINDTKVKIALKLYKYSLITGGHHTFQEFYYRIWPFIPEDPDSGWGTRVHKTIFPLTGENVGIIPKGAKGYLMDSTCNADYYSGANLSESYTIFANLYVSKGDHYKASVYCYVSDKCDGYVVSFGIGSVSINKNIVSGKVNSIYNLENNGVWQKLEVDFYCNEGDVPIIMSIYKSGVKDFSKLKGYIIFAYPQYEKISLSNNGLPPSITQSKNENTGYGTIDLVVSGIYKKNNKLLNHQECINDQNKSHIILHEKVIQHSIYSSIRFSSNTQKYFHSGIICFPLSVLIASGAIQKDLDPIRVLASRFISEDTTYYPYKANIVLDTISNSFIGDRVSRWEFALKIFSKEYNLKQKLFGGGFNFLNWYGYYFDKDKTRSDYPHNPFLSILLYSGIFGLIVYFILMYKVFYYYVKYFKEYKILAVFFIITFFFSFFSAGSPFDPPIMGFFVILPFFIHSIHRKYGDEVI